MRPICACALLLLLAWPCSAAAPRTDSARPEDRVPENIERGMMLDRVEQQKRLPGGQVRPKASRSLDLWGPAKTGAASTTGRPTIEYPQYQVPSQHKPPYEPVWDQATPSEGEATVAVSVIPKRQLEFDASEEEKGMTLSLETPSILSQHYVAEFEWIFKLPTGEFYQSPWWDQFSRNFPLNLASLGSFPLAERQLPKQTLSALVQAQPFVTAHRGHQLYEGTNQAGQPRNAGVRYEFSIKAPTMDRAKQLARDVVSAYDLARHFPAYQKVMAAKDRSDKELEQYRAARKQAEEHLQAYGKEMEDLKGFEDISAEAFANFTTQQRLVSVDVAGINARIEACNKILRHDALTPARVEQVETVKTSAEIELVGLAAKKAALEEIVTKGRRRLQLSSLIFSASSHSRGFAREISSYEDARGVYQPLWDPATFFGKIGKVSIRRIRWETPKPK